MGVNRRQRGPTYPTAVRHRARQLYAAGESPSAIVTILQREYGDELGMTPGVNTVKSWVRDLRRSADAQPADPWDFMSASPEERLLLAPVYALYWRHPSMTGAGWPPQAVADWVVRLRQLDPDAAISLVLSDAAWLTTHGKPGGMSDDDRETVLATWMDRAGRLSPAYTNEPPGGRWPQDQQAWEAHEERLLATLRGVVVARRAVRDKAAGAGPQA